MFENIFRHYAYKSFNTFCYMLGSFRDLTSLITQKINTVLQMAYKIGSTDHLQIGFEIHDKELSDKALEPRPFLNISLTPSLDFTGSNFCEGWQFLKNFNKTTACSFKTLY